MRRSSSPIRHARSALAALPLLLAACGSSPSSGGASSTSADASLQKAGSTLMASPRTYKAQAAKCKRVEPGRLP